MANKSFKVASAKMVRTFAKEQGITVGQRGRLNPEAIEAFNKANKAKRVEYREAEHKPMVEVKALKVNAKGGKTPIRKSVNIAEVREAATKAGVQVGERGRISQTILSAYVTGTLADLVTKS